MTWAGSVKMGNVLKDYKFPGMLGKTQSVRVYQALDLLSSQSLHGDEANSLDRIVLL